MLSEVPVRIVLRFSRIFVLATVGLYLYPMFSGLENQCRAEVIHVPGDYPTIQEGIDAALDGDVVEIADGAYTGALNKNLDFVGKAITVCGASGDPELCVIDCEGDGRGFYFHSGEGADSTVEGIMVTNGYVDENFLGDKYGGGVSCLSSDPTFSNCIIRGNESYGIHANGGGIYCTDSSPRLTDCQIEFNETFSNGGGFYCSDGNPVLVNCAITENRSLSGDGGGICFYLNSNPTLTDCTLMNNVGYLYGGGLSCEDSSLTMANCTISDNSILLSGGGMYCLNSDITLTDCAITGNWTTDKYDDGGGGCYFSNTGGTLTRCMVNENRIVSQCNGGGGVYCDNNSNPIFIECDISDNNIDTLESGGGLYCYESNPILIDCMLSGNKASSGGGVYCLNNSQPILLGCTITDCLVSHRGGAIHSTNLSYPILVNCLIADNISDRWGGAMYCGGISNPTLINCTIAGNRAEFGPGLACGTSDTQVILMNSILWNGPDQIWIEGEPTIAFEHCNVVDLWEGDGNFGSEPLFIDPDSSDYRLSSGSPCIDAGDNENIPIGIDMDLDGFPRFADDPAKPDMGNGVSPIVDIGCYEFQEESVHALTIAPNPLRSNQRFMYFIMNGEPNVNSWLLYSVTGRGVTYIMALDVIIDLDSPMLASGPHLTNENGDVSVVLRAPRVNEATDVWFQGVRYGEVSNYVGTRIVVE